MMNFKDPLNRLYFVGSATSSKKISFNLRIFQFLVEKNLK